MAFIGSGTRQQACTQINDDIILIHQDSMSSMNFNSCNCYLIRVSDENYAIIDPGCSKRKFNATLKQNNINFSNLKYIYITHGHSDHVALMDYLLSKNNAIESFIHHLDKKNVENASEYYKTLFNFSLIERDQKYVDFLNTINFYTGIKTNPQISESFKMVFDIWNVKDRKIDHSFNHGEMLPGDLKVIHAPGHTPGMCIFFRSQDKILFSSDIYLSSIGPNFSGANTNIYDLKTSINTIIKMVEDNSVNIILSGHGRNPINEKLNEKLNNFYEKIAIKEKQVLDLLERFDKMTLDQLTAETFKTYIKRFEKFQIKDAFQDTIVIAEASEMTSNLNILTELERLKKVKRISSENENSWAIV